MHRWKAVGALAIELGLIGAMSACGGATERKGTSGGASETMPSGSEETGGTGSEGTDDTGSRETGGTGTGGTGTGGTGGTESQSDTSVTGDPTTTSASGGGGGTGPVSTSGDVSTTGTACGGFAPCDCSPRITEIGLDEVSHVGLTANEIIAFAGGYHYATLTYGPSDFGVTTLDFLAENTPLELRIEPLGTASNISSMHIPEDSPYCFNALGIDVKATLLTGDGAFAEEFTTTLTAMSRDSVQLSVPLSLSELTGNFSVAVETDTLVMSDELKLTAHFGPGVFAGDFVAAFTPCSTANCPLPRATISSWGYCPFGGFDLDTTEDERVVLSDLLDAWDSIPPLDAVWPDDTASPLTLELSVDETGLCLESDRYRFHGQLELTTEDGRLSTSLGVDFTYTFDEYSRSVLVTGPSGESDPAVQAFELAYWNEIDTVLITLQGHLARFPTDAEEVYFRIR